LKESSPAALSPGSNILSLFISVGFLLTLYDFALERPGLPGFLAGLNFTDLSCLRKSSVNVRLV